MTALQSEHNTLARLLHDMARAHAEYDDIIKNSYVYHVTSEDVMWYLTQWMNARAAYANACISAVNLGIIPELPADFPRDGKDEFNVVPSRHG